MSEGEGAALDPLGAAGPRPRLFVGPGGSAPWRVQGGALAFPCL